MKGKQLFVLLLVVALLGGAWYLFSKRSKDSWVEDTAAGGKVIKFPINGVTRIVIKQADGEVNLVKKGDAWTVQERGSYPANFELISGLLRKLWDLKTVQEVKVGASQLPRLELVEPGKGDKAGTLVQFMGMDGKPINALLLGKKYLRKSEGGGMDFGGPAEGFPAGRYVKPLSGTKVSLVAETLDEANPRPEHWISKEFLKVESPKSITVAGASEAQRWSVARDSATGEWKLTDAKPDEKLDSSKVAPLNSILASSAPNDVLSADVKLEEPITTATLETFEGFRYEVKLGKASDDNQPAAFKVSATLPKKRTAGKDEKPEEKTKLDGEFGLKQKKLEEKLATEKKLEGRVYLLPKNSVDALLKDRKSLLAEKPVEPAKAAAPAPAVPSTAPAPAKKPSVTATTPPMAAPAPKAETASAPVQAPNTATPSRAATPAPAAVLVPPATPAAKPATPAAAKP